MAASLALLVVPWNQNRHQHLISDQSVHIKRAMETQGPEHGPEHGPNHGPKAFALKHCAHALHSTISDVCSRALPTTELGHRRHRTETQELLADSATPVPMAHLSRQTFLGVNVAALVYQLWCAVSARETISVGKERLARFGIAGAIVSRIPKNGSKSCSLEALTGPRLLPLSIVQLGRAATTR